MKITKRQLKRIIREERSRLLQEVEYGEFKPRYKGDTPAKWGAAEYARQQMAKEKPPVNMNFQMNDPGDDGAVGDIEPLVDGLLGILQTMDPTERDSEIYRIIDELETLARTGE